MQSFQETFRLLLFFPFSVFGNLLLLLSTSCSMLSRHCYSYEGKTKNIRNEISVHLNTRIKINSEEMLQIVFSHRKKINK